jgi:hypothetical protein
MSGFDRNPSPAMRRKSMEHAEVKFRKMPHNGREPIAMTDKAEVERARKLNAALSLRKLCEDHSVGKIDSATFSEVLQGYARTEFGTGRDAMAKYVAAHHAELSQKLAHDYERSQKTYNVDDAHEHQRRTTAVGYGVGVSAPAQAAGAANDGMASHNAVGNQPVQSGNESYAKFGHPRDLLVKPENIAAIKHYFGGDTIKAASYLRARGEEEYGSAT